MKLQILQCRPRGFKPLSSLIMLLQGTNYSHYAIGFTSVTGEYMILDATSKNVALRSVKYFDYEIMNEYTIEINYPLLDFMSWYESLLGEHYGYLQLIGILIKNSKLGMGIVCDELILRMLKKFTSFDDDDLDTKDLNYTDKVIRAIVNKSK